MGKAELTVKADGDRVPVNWHARFGKQHGGNTGYAVRPCADFTQLSLEDHPNGLS